MQRMHVRESEREGGCVDMLRVLRHLRAYVCTSMKCVCTLWHTVMVLTPLTITIPFPKLPRPQQSRRAPVPAELANDPSSITLDALECLLDMSVQGKGVVLGPDPVTGKG